MDKSRFFSNSFSHHIVTAIACASFLSCQEPEPNLAWVSPPQTQYSDAETDWQYVAEVSDPDAVFHLSGGADADAFVLDSITGVLRFIRQPDAGSPQDADGDRVYEVGLLATFDDLESPLILKVDVLPSGSGAPHLSFPPPGSNLAAGNDHREVTLVRAEPEYRGQHLQSVSVNGADAQLNDHGFWDMEVDYPAGETELLITANYGDGVETLRTVTVENVLREPIASDGGLPLYASSAHQFMQESGALYYLEDGSLQQWNVRTGEQQTMLGGHRFDNRIFFGVDDSEESIHIIDLGSSLDYPRQAPPVSETRMVTLSKLNLASGDQEGEAMPIELESNPIFSAYQFDPNSNTFLIEDRLLNSTLYVEPEQGVDIPFEKLSVNAENGEVEIVNHLFSIDTETDVANFSSDPLGYSLFLDWIDIDWGAKLFVGSYCGEDTVYVKDPNFGQKWWQVTREPKEKYTSVCENYNVARNAADGKSYAAFYGMHDAELVEIDLDGPSFRALKSIGGVTQYAEGSSGSAFDLVHHISIDSLNRVLYISSTEVIPIKIAGDEEAMAILRDKLWSYSLSSGSASVISESIYRLPTTFSSQRIYEVMIGKALGF